MKAVNISLVICAMLFSNAAHAEGSGWLDYVKGCLVMGGIGAGAAAIAVSQSGAKFSGSSGLAVAAGSGCLIGAFLASDVKARAEIRVAGPVTKENTELRVQVLSIEQDNCIIKGECGLDGKKLSEDEIEEKKASVLNYQSLQSGN